MITVKNSATFHSSHKKNYFGKMCKSVGYSDLKRENFSEEIVCYNKWNENVFVLGANLRATNVIHGFLKITFRN